MIRRLFLASILACSTLASTPANAALFGKKPEVAADEAVWIREGDDSRQMVIRADRQDRTGSRLRMLGWWRGFWLHS